MKTEIISFLILLIPFGIIYFLVVNIILVKWFKREEKDGAVITFITCLILWGYTLRNEISSDFFTLKIILTVVYFTLLFLTSLHIIKKDEIKSEEIDVLDDEAELNLDQLYSLVNYSKGEIKYFYSLGLLPTIETDDELRFKKGEILKRFELIESLKEKKVKVKDMKQFIDES